MGEKFMSDAVFTDLVTGEQILYLDNVEVTTMRSTETDNFISYTPLKDMKFEVTGVKVNMVWMYQLLFGINTAEATILDKLMKIKKRCRDRKQKRKAVKRINRLLWKYKLRLE